MQSGSSDLVREVAFERYVRPAIASGRQEFSIVVKDLMRELRPQGFPASNYSQICSSIKEKGFVKGNGLRIVGIDGPPSGQSSTVVVHYKRVGTGTQLPPGDEVPPGGNSQPGSTETSTTEAVRLMEGLRGLLKAELAEYGGGEAFLRWIRSEDDASPAPESTQ
jgi:hypothetical protein